MHTNIQLNASKASIRPLKNEWAPKAQTSPKPKSSGLSREEIRKIVIDMIG